MMSGRRRYRHTTSKGRFRSKYEHDIATWLNRRKVKWTYETDSYEYYVPAMTKVHCPNCGIIKGLVQRRYTPDFILNNKVIIEAKGRFLGKDRTKMKAMVKQHPELDIRMLFMADRVIKERADKITYTQWCKLYGIPSAIGPAVPESWLVGRNKPTKFEKVYVELDE